MCMCFCVCHSVEYLQNACCEGAANKDSDSDSDSECTPDHAKKANDRIFCLLRKYCTLLISEKDLES